MRIFGIGHHNISGIALIRVLEFLRDYLRDHFYLHPSDLGLSVHYFSPEGGRDGPLPMGWTAIPPYENGISVCAHIHPICPADYGVGHIMAIPIMKSEEE